ncbi:uncharacterized protein LOC115886994 isoform X2 [Sitophilus oryzae]|uniref:Uncharacterized protein LOC115886994 isoform X2 n=1 Tax=Sitophilus oryzae TaxID=7048 RepID=A0A6J2YGE2_SITOR|nr:uncharacterized protein LOC115886994 isoform X2 [Sitophilus oryzae]
MKSTVICVISIIFVLVVIQESTADLQLLRSYSLPIPKCSDTILQQIVRAEEMLKSAIATSLGKLKDTILSITVCDSLSCLKETAFGFVRGFSLHIIKKDLRNLVKHVLWFGMCLGLISVRIVFPFTKFFL